ncbi:MAG: CarD family transcriptional regulator, partial [bacterium]
MPYFTYPELKAKLDKLRRRLITTRWSTDDNNVLHLPFTPAPNYGGQLKHFFKEVGKLLQEGRRVMVISHQATRLAELFSEEDVFASPLYNIEHPPSPGSLTLVQGSLSEGWTMGESTILFTDTQIFGFVKQRRLAMKRTIHHATFLPELSPGDYAVHVDHGIARFAGMTRMRLDDVEREYLTLEYAAGDRLHVPIDQADRVSRYVGSGGDYPALSRLNTQEWERVKQRVKESTRDTARELLALYAAREVVPGFNFSADTPWQQELEASFPYIETPDQVEAVQKVKD